MLRIATAGTYISIFLTSILLCIPQAVAIQESSIVNFPSYVPLKMGQLELLQMNSSFPVRISGSVESGGSGKLEIEIENEPSTTLNFTYAGKEGSIQTTLLGSQPELSRQWLSDDTPALYVRANGSYITMEVHTNASGWASPINLKWTGEWISSPFEEDNYKLNWENKKNITLFHKGSSFTHDSITVNITFRYNAKFIIGLAERNEAPLNWLPLWISFTSPSVILNVETIPFSFYRVSAVAIPIIASIIVAILYKMSRKKPSSSHLLLASGTVLILASIFANFYNTPQYITIDRGYGSYSYWITGYPYQAVAFPLAIIGIIVIVTGLIINFKKKIKSTPAAEEDTLPN